jgi:integrase
MTPDTLRIDRMFRGVGRIAKATGTTNPAVRRKINRMLTAFRDEGRLDLLRAIRDDQLSLLQALDAYTRKSLDELPVGQTARNLAAAFAAWQAGLRAPIDCSLDHLRTLGTTQRHLLAARPKALLAEAPAVLEALRDTLGKRAPRSFNLTRAHVLAFVRATLKRSHPLWLACAAVELRKVTPSQKRSTLTPDQMRNWFPSPDTDPVDAIAWAMVTTGMGAKEYWGAWHILADRIRIEGTKREGRRRDVPLAWRPSAPALSRRTWEDKLRERTDRQITPYDLRRTYATWLESAGIPRTRRRIFMGHGTKDITDLYEAHEVAAFLAADGQKLRAWLGLPEAPVAPLRLAR